MSHLSFLKCQHHNAVCIIQFFLSSNIDSEAVNLTITMATKPTDSGMDTGLDTSLFYLCMHYQHAFKWTNSAWTLCVMLCCVCRQLAHHNHHIAPRWLGIPPKCVHTLGLCACELAADTSAVGQGLLPHCLHLRWMCCIHVPWRVLFARLSACYLSCCYIFHALQLQAASPGVDLHHLVGLYLSPFANDMSVPGRIIMVVLSDQCLERDSHRTEMSRVHLLNQVACFLRAFMSRSLNS